MAEQNYDVMISSKEYNELRNYKKEHAQLGEQNAKLTKRLGEVEKQLGINRQELNRKKAENTYLLQLIQNIVCVEFIQPPPALQTNKSASFEVLGESIFQPQKAEEHRFNLQMAEMAKKYSTVVEKINQFNKQNQERDEQISKLKQTISQNQATINRIKGINQWSVEKKLKESLQLQKIINEKKIQQLQAEILVLKKKLNQAESELKKQLSDLSQFQKESKNIKVLLQKHKEQNNKLTGLLKDFSERNKILQKEIDNLKKKGNNSSPNLETIVKIKCLIDEHVREVQKNLKSIQGLSHEQITNLVRSQLKQLMEYISKSIENKK